MEKSKIAIVKKTVKYTEMTVYSDLVVKNKAKTKLRAIGVKDSDPVFLKKPSVCSECNKNIIINIEVLGACEDVLFWMCDDCEHIHLKMSHDLTEKYLVKASEYWSNPNDWKDIEKENMV